ncbi:MAG: hypothetical protein LBL13_09395 [Bacteroidales bacterium]|jgi:hypothetical protein|nr:hypothetical protein [Bacteroidales bacterium]
MTAIELNAKKIELIKEIDSEELLDKMLAYLHRLKKKGSKPPCQYTLDELKERIDRAEENIKQGEYLTHEELEEQLLKW